MYRELKVCKGLALAHNRCEVLKKYDDLYLKNKTEYYIKNITLILFKQKLQD